MPRLYAEDKLPDDIILLYCKLHAEGFDMKFSELVEQGLTETEKREFLADGDMTAITFRIPRNLKEASQEEARNRGTSFSSFVRSCLMQELSKDRK